MLISDDKFLFILMTLTVICAADSDIDASMRLILENLRNESGFQALRRWSPKNETIIVAKTKIFEWILHPRNIHKFKDDHSVQALGEGSPLGKMIYKVFSKHAGTEEFNKVKRILSSSVCKKKESNLAAFLSAVVKVHTRCCLICNTL